MYSVKKLQPETELIKVQLDGKAVGLKTQKHVTYAVVDSNGEIVKSSNNQYEIYSKKSIAQMVVNHYNSK